MSGSIAELSEELCQDDEAWLLLFDIDGTLVDTGGKGLSALHRTGVEVFGGDAPPLDLAGSTDLGILASLYEHFGAEESVEKSHVFFEAYHRHLTDSLESNPAEGRVLDGAVELLEKLESKKHLQLALLTGNTAQGAQIKLRHYGMGQRFSFGAFGSDRADRNELGVIALARAQAITGRQYQPDRVLIIGDTPKDINCAHAIGARCVAVATGKFNAQQLEEAGGDWVIDSLNEINLG